LDANSLYATAQSEPLPIGNFRFLSDEEINDFDPSKQMQKWGTLLNVTSPILRTCTIVTTTIQWHRTI